FEIKKIMAKVGRPLAIETPDEMWELFKGYVEWTKSNPIKVQDYVGKDAAMVYREKERPLTLIGFSAWLYEQGILKSIKHYFTNSNGNYDEFLAVTTRIREVIEADQVSGGLVGIYNPNLTARLNGLVDKTETKVDAKVEKIDYSQLSEEALNEIARLKS